jgi:hypothetical protein
MKLNNSSAGAMPVAAGAMPAQSYPTGPVWASYKLPFPGTCGARDAGVCFEGESDGATPAAPPANSAPPAPPAAPATPPPPATGDDGLGEAGKKAIAAERKAAKEAQDALKTAQAELEALRTQGLSESEKAIKEASNTAAAAERAKWQSSIRAVRVESALRVAGASNEKLLELALRSDLVSALKVDEAGKVEGLDAAIAKLKEEIPEMFGAPASGGGPTRGAVTGAAGQAKTLEEAVAGHYKQP